MMQKPSKYSVICAMLAMSLCQSAFAGDLERRQAKRIHDRLTGVPATNTVIDSMETALLSDPTGKTAAQIAIQTPDPTNPTPGARAFYNVTLKNFVAPWTNEEQSAFTPLNDYTATAIGMIRDGVDFRQILSADMIYVGNNTTGYSNSSNAHYEELEALGPVAGNLGDPNILQQQFQSIVTGITSSATAGIMTTRGAAKSFFSDGTNRAMFRFTMMNHLCTDLEPLKDISRTPDRVRQDVSRSPGGDSRIFLNSCVGCHAGMDGMAGAFANYQYDYTTDKETGRLIYTSGTVQPKHLINSTNFKSGHITIDDSWINYWRNGQNWRLGWGHPGETLDTKGNAIGNGAKALGIELANSQAFAQCQIDKTFQSLCFRDPNDYAIDRTERDSILSDFKAGGYNMKQVFGDVAAWCKGS